MSTAPGRSIPYVSFSWVALTNLAGPIECILITSLAFMGQQSINFAFRWVRQHRLAPRALVGLLGLATFMDEESCVGCLERDHVADCLRIEEWELDDVLATLAAAGMLEVRPEEQNEQCLRYRLPRCQRPVSYDRTTDELLVAIWNHERLLERGGDIGEQFEILLELALRRNPHTALCTGTVRELAAATALEQREVGKALKALRVGGEIVKVATSKFRILLEGDAK